MSGPGESPVQQVTSNPAQESIAPPVEHQTVTTLSQMVEMPITPVVEMVTVSQPLPDSGVETSEQVDLPAQGTVMSEVRTSGHVDSAGLPRQVNSTMVGIMTVHSEGQVPEQVVIIPDNIHMQEMSAMESVPFQTTSAPSLSSYEFSIPSGQAMVYSTAGQHQAGQTVASECVLPEGSGGSVVPQTMPDGSQHLPVEVPVQTQVTVQNVEVFAPESTPTAVTAGADQIQLMTQQGQSVAMETSDEIQPGVVYVVTQDPARVPTKASRKAFIAEGQPVPQEILILPEGQTDQSGQFADGNQVQQMIQVVQQQPEQAADGQQAEEISGLEREFHSGTMSEKSHACHTCGESFFMYLELLRHVMSAHSNALPSQEKVLVEQAGQDPIELYECSECQLRFKKVEHLNEHIAMHFAVKVGTEKGQAQAAKVSPEEVEGEEDEVEEEVEDEEDVPKKVSERKYACDQCDKKFTRAFGLKNHKLVHSGEKPYECDICRKSFREQSKLKNHMAMHTDAKPHICPVCAKAFAAAAYLRTHMMIHTGKKPYKCTQCDMAFISSGNLKRHTRVHTGEKPFVCDFCGASFAQMGNLESHKRTHTGVRPYECEVCGKGFMQSSGLVEHIRTHSGVKPYSCDVCGRAFAGSSGLRVHKRTHTGEKPHECDICFKRFAASGNLKTHQKIHANIRPFKCSFCNKSFIASGNLTQHLRIHTGEKPHKCTICDKAFTGTGGLKIHMMGHYDEKPFMCEYCDKGFKTKQKLTAHTRAHTGERPFSCTICGKAFAMTEKLKLHVKTKHGPGPTKPAGKPIARRPVPVAAGVEHAVVADFDDDLEPPVLSPQPMTPLLHVPPPEPEPEKLITRTSPRKTRQKPAAASDGSGGQLTDENVTQAMEVN